MKTSAFVACLAIAFGLAATAAASVASPSGGGHAAAKKRHCHRRRHRHGKLARRSCSKRRAPASHLPPAAPPGPVAAPPAPAGPPATEETPGGEIPGGGQEGGEEPPPPAFETVDLVPDSGFEGAEEPVECFAPYGDDGVVSIESGKPLAGSQSLDVKVKPFGRVACGREYGEGEGPIVRLVRLEADVRIDAPSSGEGLKVCAIVYYSNEDIQNECGPAPLSLAEHGVVHVLRTIPIDERRIQRVFFQLEAGGVETEATVDEAHLSIERKVGSEGQGGGGGGGGEGGGGPGSSVGRFAAMVSPTDGETFTTPLNLRLIGIGHDPNIFTNEDKHHEESPGHGTNAAKVEFLLDGQVIGEEDGEEAEYHVFKTFAENLDVAPGQHTVVARATYEEPAEVIESEPTTITVVAPPAYAQTVDLTHDVVLNASNPSLELIGSPTERIKLNGNGHRIVSTGTSGHLVLKDVDVYNLGDPSNTSAPGIEVTANAAGTVAIEGSSFDFSNPVDLELDGSSTAKLDDNLFRSNMRMPIGQEPGPDPEHISPTVPVISITGSSAGNKEFAGNNVGAGPVQFERVNHWTIGGPSDADTNVLIGPRAAFEVLRSANVTVEGNFVNHVYYGGWSQGQLLELSETSPIKVEHNVLLDSSWPVRGIEGEFAYNLVLEAGHQWMVPGDGAYIHHNIFVGGDNDTGGITEYYPNTTRIENNTFDGLMGPMVRAAIFWENGQTTLKSNSFIDFPSWATAVVYDQGGTIDAGYNAFFNPLATTYLGAVTPRHDINGGASTDPRFARPLPTSTFEGDKVAVWKRQLPVSQILSEYRARYTPTQSSPYVDAGDPSLCTCNDVGAVGAGAEIDPLDRFGSFSQPGWVPPPTPPSP
jgi:hypothetical protein